MLDVIIKLLPIFLFFFLGIFLSKVRFANGENADFLLRLVFFVTLPALVLLKLPQTFLGPDKLFLPLITIAVNLACMAVTLLVSRFGGIQPRTMGAMLVSTMIANNVFMFPFILAGFGGQGFADAVLLDFGNGLTTATVTYLVAFKYGSERADATMMLVRLIRSPLFWAFVIAIGMNVLAVESPDAIKRFLEEVGQMTSPLILIALGILFQPRIAGLPRVGLTIAIRVGVGLAVGTGLALVLGISGQTFAVVALCSAAPVGFMALTFSSIAQLDKDFASKVVSVSILLGVIYVPILMSLLGGMP
jgi:predicted permease